MTYPPFLLLLALLAPIAHDHDASAVPAADVVAKVLAAYGGLAEWSSAETVSETGHVRSIMRNTESTIARSYRYAGTLRVEVGKPNGAEVRELVDGRGWTNNAEVTGPQLDAMILQAARMGLPLLLADPASKVKDNGEVERDGLRLHELEIDLTAGKSLVVQIDTSDWHIVRSIGRAPSPQFGTGTIEFATDYLDFRLVDGLLFSFHEINYAQGRKTGETTLDNIYVSRDGKPEHPTVPKKGTTHKATHNPPPLPSNHSRSSTIEHAC